MTDLQGAMRNVDAQEREDRVGGAGAPFRPSPPPTLRAVAGRDPSHEEAAREAERLVREEIETRRGKEARAYGRAFAVVSEALTDGGHDPSHIPDMAAMFQRAIGDMLLQIATTAPKETTRRFGADSDAGSMAKGGGVAEALSGAKA